MIVVEGSDLLGKTTASKTMVKIARSMGHMALYAHMSRPPESFKFSVPEYAALMNPFFIYDRFHYGATVWHKDCMDDCVFQIIHSKIRAIGGLCVVLFTSDEDWYSSALVKDDKSHLHFSVGDLLVANRQYKSGFRKESDFFFDIKDGQFPTENRLYGIVEQWLLRRMDAGTM